MEGEIKIKKKLLKRVSYFVVGVILLLFIFWAIKNSEEHDPLTNYTWNIFNDSWSNENEKPQLKIQEINNKDETVTAELFTQDVSANSSDSSSIHVNLPQQLKEDDFDKVEKLHWGKIPITYKFENENTGRQTNLTRTAFSKIEEETGGVVRFEESMDNPGITIYFKPMNYTYGYGHTEADARIGEVDTSRNLILKGEINFYGEGILCNTGYPALEVHEILHLFDIPHSPLSRSVMFPHNIDPSASSDCTVNKIDKEYISCLRYIYSNGKIEGNCDFPNVIHEKEPKYVCGDGLYPVAGTDYCCPEPNMKIVDDYCSY